MEVKLPKTIQGCHDLIENLFSVIEKMQEQIDELEARLNQNSQNSNRPPSSDGVGRPNPKPGLSRKKKKRGGQKGHQGKTLRQIQEPDEVIECEPKGCVCGDGKWSKEVEIAEFRQVFELPEPRLQVIEYQRLRRICECGETSFGEFPAEVSAPVQYGVRVQALATMLSVQGCLSYEKIGQLFADLYGYELNTATAQEMVKRTSRLIPMEQIKQAVKESKTVNLDETSVRENGKNHWLHNASTESWTYQYAHEKRGTQAMVDEKSVLLEYFGVGVHDCWASYFKFTDFKHAVCNAHILRELSGVMENSAVKWAGRMKRLLLRMYVASKYGKEVVKDIWKYEIKYEQLLKLAESEEPPPKREKARGKLKRTKGRNLFERMKKHKQAVLRFAQEKEVPFTNNQAERDIRPIKVKQKVSGGFRSSEGLESYCRVNSFISSMRKQNRQVYKELVSIIKGNQFEAFQT